MTRKPNPDRPLAERGDDVGVIGVSEDNSPQPQPTAFSPRAVTDLPADKGEKDEDAIGAFSAEGRLPQEPEPEEADVFFLPDEAFDSPGFYAANNAAKEAFDNVVLSTGHTFRATGRYYNIYDLDDVYDVRDGLQVPEGKFLIGEPYLLNEPERSRAVRRRDRR